MRFSVNGFYAHGSLICPVQYDRKSSHKNWSKIDLAPWYLQNRPAMLPDPRRHGSGSLADAENARLQFVTIRKDIRVEADNSFVLPDDTLSQLLDDGSIELFPRLVSERKDV